MQTQGLRWEAQLEAMQPPPGKEAVQPGARGRSAAARSAGQEWPQPGARGRPEPGWTEGYVVTQSLHPLTFIPTDESLLRHNRHVSMWTSPPLARLQICWEGTRPS